MPSFPSIELPKFELPKFELPDFELPRFELPNFELPKVELPELPDLPSVDQVLGVARDAVYVGIGLAVMTVERVQEWSKQAVEAITEQVEKARAAAN